MGDKPILFSGPMVRALLEGRKTQTRRVQKCDMGMAGAVDHSSGKPIAIDEKAWDRRWPIRTKYSTGDRLWVREAHALLPATAYGMSVGTGTIAQVEHPSDGYTAAVFREGFDRSGRPSWRPSIHMPRWASRLTLIVTEVRVQRLQDTTLGDICAEGLAGSIYDFKPVQRGFEAWESLWDSLNADQAPWASNPWVAAYSFRVIPANIDQIGGEA